jgi:hypothetical protein
VGKELGPQNCAPPSRPASPKHPSRRDLGRNALSAAIEAAETARLLRGLAANAARLLRGLAANAARHARLQCEPRAPT